VGACDDVKLNWLAIFSACAASGPFYSRRCDGGPSSTRVGAVVEAWRNKALVRTANRCFINRSDETDSGILEKVIKKPAPLIPPTPPMHRAWLCFLSSLWLWGGWLCCFWGRAPSTSRPLGLTSEGGATTARLPRNQRRKEEPPAPRFVCSLLSTDPPPRPR
jgi:hypothetical protein